MKKKSSLFRIIPSKTRSSFNHKTLLHYRVVRPLRILVYALDRTPSILSIRRCHLSKSTCEVGSHKKRFLPYFSIQRTRFQRRWNFHNQCDKRMYCMKMCLLQKVKRYYTSNGIRDGCIIEPELKRNDTLLRSK